MSAAGASSNHKANEKDQIQLSKSRYVTVGEFRNVLRVDIREFYVNEKNERLPGRKGISLSLEEWTKLKDSVDKLDNIIKRLNGETVDDDESDEVEEVEKIEKIEKIEKVKETKKAKKAKMSTSESESD